MPVYKDKNKNTWYVMCWYRDWQGTRKQKCKRGFETKKKAQEWEREFLLQQQSDVSMTMESFFKLYERDVKPKLKLNTWLTKEHIAQKKILPYFGKRKISDITPQDVIEWQNTMRSVRYGKDDKPYAPTYLKTVNNQLNAMFNHAVKFYGLQSNPAAKAGSMGSGKGEEMLFWTKEEYLTFVEAMMEKPRSYYAFEMLYWTGIREGELLALTKRDFDFSTKILRINKSYQRLEGQDVITEPKTPKSNRRILMSDSLCEEMKDYFAMYANLDDDARIFQFTKSYLYYEMRRGCKVTGVQQIRIHDLRHSHVSLLINMGFSALAIGDRVGHEAIDITYRYAHLFPTTQTEMAEKLEKERGLADVSKEL